MRPLHHRMSRVRSWVIIALIWVLSCSLAFPGVLFSATMTIRYANGQSKTVCFVQWPDGRFPSSETEYVYNIIFLGVTYLIPVLLMGVCYSLMGRELWGSRSIGEQTSRQLDAIKSKRKVIRMFIVVVTIFAVCWLPYHAYYIIIFHRRELSRSAYVHHLYLFFYWLAMSNAMVNPLIYYWMNRKFRVYFRQAICHCFCVRPNYKHDLEVVTGVKRGGSVSNFNRSCRSGGHPQRALSARRDQFETQEMRVKTLIVSATRTLQNGIAPINTKQRQNGHDARYLTSSDCEYHIHQDIDKNGV